MWQEGHWFLPALFLMSHSKPFSVLAGAIKSILVSISVLIITKTEHPLWLNLETVFDLLRSYIWPQPAKAKHMSKGALGYLQGLCWHALAVWHHMPTCLLQRLPTEPLQATCGLILDLVKACQEVTSVPGSVTGAVMDEALWRLGHVFYPNPCFLSKHFPHPCACQFLQL